MIPIAGSAYTYAYATLGEIIAWIIGWDLILEYAVANMAVAVGFSAYFNDVLESLFGVQSARSAQPAHDRRAAEYTGCLVQSAGVPDPDVLTVLLVQGIRESAGANNIIVLIKMAAILIFVFGAARAVDTAN